MERMRRSRAVAPAIFWYEIRNMLLVNERRKRIDAAQGRAALKVLRALPIDEDGEAEETRQMDLARRQNLTAYDVAYLELALRLGAPLATFDEALRKAAMAEGVELLSAAP